MHPTDHPRSTIWLRTTDIPHERETDISTKEKVLELVEQLPADATIDEVMERLYFLSKVERGLDQLAEGQTVPYDEVKRRFKK